MFKVDRSYLEPQFSTKAKGRRILEDQAAAPERVKHRSNTRHTTIDAVGLIQRNRTLSVGDIEPVRSDAELPAFTDLDRIVSTEVEVKRERRAVCARLDPSRII